MVLHRRLSHKTGELTFHAEPCSSEHSVVKQLRNRKSISENFELYSNATLDGFGAKETTRASSCYSAQLRVNVGLDMSCSAVNYDQPSVSSLN